MRNRGSVLLHVLVTGVLVALIVATLMRMTMLRYRVTARSARALQEKRSDQAALASLTGVWNLRNIVCASPTPDYTCSPASVAVPGVCGCTCTPVTLGFPTVTARVVGGVCTLNIVSTDLP